MPDEMSLNPLSTDQWDTSLGPIVDDMNGKPLHVHGLLAHHPALLRAWWSSRQYLVSGGTLGSRLGELVILRVGVKMKTWYEWAAHVVRGRVAGLSEEEIQRVLEGSSALGWSESDAVIVQVVDELFDQRGLSSATLVRFARHYNSQQLLDLMAIHGMYVFLGGVLNTWNPDLETQLLAQLPGSVNRQAFEAAMTRHAKPCPTGERGLRAASKKRLNALRVQDWAALEALLNPDLQYIHATGVKQDFSTYLRYVQQGTQYLSAESEIETANTHGDMGMVSGYLDIRLVRPDGSEYCARSSITELWQWDGASWKLCVFQSTAIQGR